MWFFFVNFLNIIINKKSTGAIAFILRDLERDCIFIFSVETRRRTNGAIKSRIW